MGYPSLLQLFLGWTKYVFFQENGYLPPAPKQVHSSSINHMNILSFSKVQGTVSPLYKVLKEQRSDGSKVQVI